MYIMDQANPIHFQKVPDMITYSYANSPIVATSFLKVSEPEVHRCGEFDSYVLTYRPIGSGETLLSYNIYIVIRLERTLSPDWPDLYS